MYCDGDHNLVPRAFPLKNGWGEIDGDHSWRIRKKTISYWPIKSCSSHANFFAKHVDFISTGTVICVHTNLIRLLYDLTGAPNDGFCEMHWKQRQCILGGRAVTIVAFLEKYISWVEEICKRRSTNARRFPGSPPPPPPPHGMNRSVRSQEPKDLKPYG